MGALVLGSMAHPRAVTALGPVVIASIAPNGLLDTVTARQPNWVLVPGPVLIPYRQTVWVPGVVAIVRV